MHAPGLSMETGILFQFPGLNAMSNPSEDGDKEFKIYA
jgi:hypothetical protein